MDEMDLNKCGQWNKNLRAETDFINWSTIRVGQQGERKGGRCNKCAEAIRAQTACLEPVLFSCFIHAHR